MPLSARSIERSGNVTLFVRSKFGATGQVNRIADRPLAMFTKNAKSALGSVQYNYQNAAWKPAHSAVLDGEKSAVAGGRIGQC